MSTPEWVVENVVPKEDYTLLLTFADGSKRIYDAKLLLTDPMFVKLKKPSFFMKAREKYGTVIWTNDIDIAPEHLYECSKIVN